MTTLDKMLQGLANALGASLSTLTTTAKTVVGAINELKSGLTTANTNISTNTTKIGTGSLNTTSQTLIGAVNELAARGSVVTGYFNGTAKSSPVASFVAPKSGTFILIAATYGAEGISVTGVTASMAENVMQGDTPYRTCFVYGTVSANATVTIRNGYAYYDSSNTRTSGVYFII